MTDLFFFNNYDHSLDEFDPEFTSYLESLSDKDLGKELLFAKKFLSSFSSVLNHCASVYQLYISEKIVGIIMSNQNPSASDLQAISDTCREMVDYLHSQTFSTEKSAYENYPDYWGYLSGFDREKMMEQIEDAAENCFELYEDYNYVIYKLNQIIGFNDYVLGKEVCDEHALKVIDNALTDNDLKSIGIVETENGYDLTERIRHIELVLNWLFYEYIF